MLAEVPVEVVDPAQLGIRLDVVEDGSTFEANARIKAEAGLRLSRLATLADDSGLEVPALGGRPGVHSARFAGPGASGADLIRALLRELGPQARRSPTAFFHCTAVLLLPGGRWFVGDGLLEGTIADEPRGVHGFGFDPIFVLPDGRHLAELSLEDKNLLSHRARAIAALEVHGGFDAMVTARHGDDAG